MAANAQVFSPPNVDSFTSDFARAIAVDGDYLAVGAPDHDVGATNAGVVLVFELDEQLEWQFAFEIAPPKVESQGRFGSALALKDSTLVVVARGVDQRGMTYVFDRQLDGTWTKTTELSPIGFTSSANQLGSAVEFDGSRIAVGVSDGGFSFGAGAVCLYERASNGTWAHEQTLHCPTSISGFETGAARFGEALALKGQDLVVGAPELDYLGVRRGAFFAYRRAANGEWQLVQFVPGVPTSSNTNFGTALAVRGDTLVVSAPFSSPNLWLYESAGFGLWTSMGTAVLETPLIGTSGGEEVTFLGERLVVRTNAQFGKNYTFLQQGADGVWRQEILITAQNPAVARGFGAGTCGGRLCFFTSRYTQPIVDVSEYVLGELYRDVAGVSTATGGTQTLALGAGEQAADDIHILLGSLSGTSPGFALGGEAGLVLPLVVDAYTLLLVEATGAGFLQPWSGQLDGFGRASATFELPAGVAAAFAGQQLHHAFVVLDGVTLALKSVSNPVALALLP